jgi:type VI secretion system protein VasG
VERAWVFGTLMFGESQVRSGHLLFGMLKTANLRNALYAMSRQFERVKAEDAVRPLCEAAEGIAGSEAGRQRRLPGWASRKR